MIDHYPMYWQIAWASYSPTKNLRLLIWTTVQATAILPCKSKLYRGNRAVRLKWYPKLMACHGRLLSMCGPCHPLIQNDRVLY